MGLLRGPPVHLTVKEDARPRFCKAQTVPYALKQMVSEELDRMVNKSVLSPVASAEWATPAVPVVKHGHVRLCGDFRLTVNAATILKQYPLPRVYLYESQRRRSFQHIRLTERLESTAPGQGPLPLDSDVGVVTAMSRSESSATAGTSFCSDASTAKRPLEGSFCKKSSMNNVPSTAFVVSPRNRCMCRNS